jgi:hypothetical protein
MRRVIVVVTLLVVGALVVALLATISANDSETTATIGTTNCVARRYIILEAQSVPSAQLVPCVSEDLEGWVLSNENYTNGESSISWGTNAGTTDSGVGAGWKLELAPSCTPPPAATVEPDLNGATRRSLDTNANSIAIHQEWFQFTGGCVTSTSSIPDRFDEQRIFDELDAAFTLAPRAAVNDYVRVESDGAFGLDPAPTPTP